MVAFINSFLSYLLLTIIMLAIIVVAIILGKKARDIKSQNDVSKTSEGLENKVEE